MSELKIDRTFVSHVEGSQTDRAIVGSVISLAHTLGLNVVAEGVEGDATFAALAAENCDAAQGYGILPPRPAPEVLTWLRERTVAGAAVLA